MNAKVERRRAFIINVIFFIFVLGAFYFFMEYAFGLVFPFLVAFCVALLLQKPIDAIMRRTRMKRSLASALSVLLVLLVVGFGFSALMVKLVVELKGFFSFISVEIGRLPETFEGIKGWVLRYLYLLPDSVEPKVQQYIQELSIDALVKTMGEDFSVSWLTSPLGGVWNTAKQIPSLVVAIFITIISSFFMTLDFHIIRDFFYNQFSQGRAEKLRRTKQVILSSVGKLLKAYLILMIITFTEVFLGLSLLRLLGVYKGGYSMSIALLTALVDILPVLGSGTVLLPWAIYSLITSNVGMGVGLLLLYVVILVLRQVLEPKLVANQVGLPAVVTIIGMYLGTKIFGPIGLFLVPFLIILLKLLNDEGILRLFKSGAEREKENEEQSDCVAREVLPDNPEE